MPLCLVLGRNMMSSTLLLFTILSTSAAFLTPNTFIIKSNTRYRNSATAINANINFKNFWIRTLANWTVCEAPPDREPDFVSRSGSKYWNHDDHDAVIRQSDHWTGQHGVTRIVDCYWRINQEQEFEQTMTGSCRYSDFEKVKKKGRKTMMERGVEAKERREKVDLVKANITFDNFWRSTEAHFEACASVPQREPDFQSKSGSKYWNEGDFVVRLSDHWSGQMGVTKIVDCRWYIDQQLKVKAAISGRCLYENFVRRRKKSRKMTWRKLSN